MAANENPPIHRLLADSTRSLETRLAELPRPPFQPPRVPTLMEELTGTALTCTNKHCVPRNRRPQDSVFECLRHGPHAVTVLQSFTTTRLVNLIDKAAIAAKADGPELAAQAAAELITCRLDHGLLAAHDPRCEDRDSEICDTTDCPRSATPVCRPDRTQATCVTWGLRLTVDALGDMAWPAPSTSPAGDRALPEVRLCANGYALASVMIALVDAMVDGDVGEVLRAAAMTSPEAHGEVTWLLLAVLAHTKPAYLTNALANADNDRFRKECPAPLGQRPERYGVNSKTGRAVCGDDIDVVLLGRLGAAANQSRREIALHTAGGGRNFGDEGTIVQAADAFLNPLEGSVIVLGEGTAVGADLGEYLLEQARRYVKNRDPELGLKLTLISPREAAARVHDCLLRLRALDPRAYEELTALRQSLGSGLSIDEIAFISIDLDDTAAQLLLNRPDVIVPLALREPITAAERAWLTKTGRMVHRTLTDGPDRDLQSAITAGLARPGTPTRWRTAASDPVTLNDLLTHLAEIHEARR